MVVSSNVDLIAVYVKKQNFMWHAKLKLLYVFAYKHSYAGTYRSLSAAAGIQIFLPVSIGSFEKNAKNCFHKL